MAAGIGLDLLAWGRPVGPGLASTLALVVVAIWSSVRIHGRPDAQATLLFAAAVAMALVPAFRSSLVVVGLAVFAWVVLVALAVARSRDGDLRLWAMTRYFRAGFEWPLALVEPARMGSAELDGARASGVALARRGLPAVRALAISWVVLTFFTVLLSAADPIFGGIVAETLDVDLSPDRVVRFALVAGVAAWAVLGMSRRAVGRQAPRTEFRPSRFGLTEALAVTASLNLLFAGFLAVQFTYLFDGRVGRVDLGYAQYARKGFFELVFVAGCVLALILVIDWFIAVRMRSLDLLHLALIGQTLVMAWSAVVRMMAYTSEFGLSELRLYTTAFMAWIAVMMALTAVTVLRGRRDSFALGAFIAGLAAVVALVAVSPDALIAETNLARLDSGHDVDVAYLASLSVDAVPAMVARFGAVDPETRSELSAALDSTRADLVDRADRWGWRSWSWAHHRADASLARSG
jgi:hypothetical protein